MADPLPPADPPLDPPLDPPEAIAGPTPAPGGWRQAVEWGRDYSEPPPPEPPPPAGPAIRLSNVVTGTVGARRPKGPFGKTGPIDVEAVPLAPGEVRYDVTLDDVRKMHRQGIPVGVGDLKGLEVGGFTVEPSARAAVSAGLSLERGGGARTTELTEAAKAAPEEQFGSEHLVKMYGAMPARWAGLGAGLITALMPTKTTRSRVLGLTEEAHHAVEEHLQRTLEETITGGRGFVENLRTDMADNAMAIADLMRALGPEPGLRGELHKGWAKFFGAQFGSGEKEVHRLVGGLVGGTAALFQNPTATAATKPITTAALLFPALRAAARKNPALRRLATSAERVAKALTTIDAAYARVFPIRRRSALTWAWFKRFLDDTAAMSNETAAAVAERMILEPRETQAAVLAAANEVARAVEQGRILPEEAVGMRLDVPEVQASIAAQTEAMASASALERTKFLTQKLLDKKTPESAVAPLRKAMDDALSDLRQQAAQLDAAQHSITADRLSTRKAAELSALVDEHHALISSLDDLGPGDPLAGQRAGTPLTEPKTTVVLEQTIEGPLHYTPDFMDTLRSLESNPELVDAARALLPLEEQALGAAGRSDVLAQSSGRQRRPVDWQMNLRNHEATGPAIKELERQLVGTLPRESLIRDVTVEPIVRLEMDIIKHRGGRLTGRDVVEAIGGPLREGSTSILRSPEFALAVAKSIHKRYPSQTVRGTLHRLNDMAKASLLDSPFEYVVKTPEGKQINLQAETTRVLWERKPKERARFMASAIRNVGDMLAADMEKFRSGQALLREWQRFRRPGRPFQLHRYANDIAMGVLVEGEHPPLVLSGAKPRDIQRALKNNMDVASQVAEGLGISATEAMTRVNNLANDINSRYRPPSDVLRRQFPVNVAPAESIKRGGIMRAQDLPQQVTAVDGEFNHGMTWHFRALEAMRENPTPLDAPMRAIKTALTVMNPSMWKNILGANVVLLAGSRGTTPVGVAASLSKTLRHYRRYTKGDATYARDFRALQGTGALNATLVEAELTALGSGGTIVGPARRAIDAGVKKLKKGYSWMDNAFKLDIGFRNLRWERELLAKITPGHEVTLRTSRNKFVTLRKTPDGKWARKGKVYSERGLDSVLAKAALQPALDLFIDMPRQGVWINMLRASRAGGVVSPFVSWAMSALDIPFLKKGLAYRMISGDRPLIRTTDPAASSIIAMQDARFAARRTLTASAMRSSLLSQPEDEARDMFTRMGRGPGTILVERATDPSLLAFQDWTYAYPYIGLESLLRLGTGFFKPSSEVAMSAAKIAELPAAERANAKALKAYWAKVEGEGRDNMGDVLELISLGGGPIAEMVTRATDPRYHGESGRMNFVRDFGTLLMGGAAHSVFDVAIAHWDEASEYSTRQWAVSKTDPRETTQLLQWTVWRLGLGRAWKTRNFGKFAQERVRLVKRRLKESFSGAINRRIDNLVGLSKAADLRGDTAEVERREKEISLATKKMEESLALIGEAVDLAWEDYSTVIERTQRPRRKPSPEGVE